MKASPAMLGAAAIVAATTAAAFAALYFMKDAPADTAGAAPCAYEKTTFGHISSMAREGDHFVLRFDPAWFLSGITANVAAAEDGAVEPGEPVPNDNYRLEEGHRLLTYIVPPDADVTVLTSEGDPAQLGATPISVAELARIVNGGKHRPLFEPLDTGVWIRYSIDTVCSIDHQYQP